MLDISEPGEITKVNSRVITTSSKSEEEDVIVKKKNVLRVFDGRFESSER